MAITTKQRLVNAREIKFVAVMDDPVTKEMAMEWQNADYPVAGYGFFGFKCVERDDGRYEATWGCFDSCD